MAVLRKIYAALREETSLVRRYVLRVIHLLTKSMRLFESPAIQQVHCVLHLYASSKVI